MTLYNSTLRTLSLAPKDRPVSLLMRHSERYPIIVQEDVLTAKLTPPGIKMAEEFGSVLSQVYNPGCFVSSPIERCIQTAAAISYGAGWNRPVIPDDRLSYPLLEKAWMDFLDDPEIPNKLPEPVMELLDLMLSTDSNKPGLLNVFVTHDSVLGCILAYLMNLQVEEATWPNFMEGMALWREENRIFAIWREQKTEISRWFAGEYRSLHLG